MKVRGKLLHSVRYLDPLGAWRHGFNTAPLRPRMREQSRNDVKPTTIKPLPPPRKTETISGPGSLLKGTPTRMAPERAMVRQIVRAVRPLLTRLRPGPVHDEGRGKGISRALIAARTQCHAASRDGDIQNRAARARRRLPPVRARPSH